MTNSDRNSTTPTTDYNNDPPFAGINGTARNNREDSEDINHNGRLDQDNGYFTYTIDLADDSAVIDVVNDYDGGVYDTVGEMVEADIAWRLYQFRVNEAVPVSEGAEPELNHITHLRIWYEGDEGNNPDITRLQIARMRFISAEAKTKFLGF